MASSDAATLIEARLFTEWGILHPTVPIYHWEETNPDIGADPTVSFMVLEYPSGVGTQKSLGAPGENWFNEVSTFILHLYYPTGELAENARQLLSDAATIFRSHSEGSSGECIIYRAPFPPSPGLRNELSGNFMSLSMSIPYEYRMTA